MPGLYTKLLDVDKVDLVISGYGTNMIAPALPVIMQHKRTFLGAAWPRGEQRVQLPELLLDRADRRPAAEAELLEGLLRGRDGAEPEADRRWRSSAPTRSSRTTRWTARVNWPRKPG